MSAKVGFVGLGIMGKGMLKNLATKMDGASFVIWNRSPDACAEFKAAYPDQIEIAASPADVVKSCDVTYSMLSTIAASEAVFDKEGDGVIAGVSEGKIIVDCATFSAERMTTISEAVKAKGGKFMEAPVSGSKVPAEQGSLIFLCGGDEDVYGIAGPALDCMGKAKFYFGEIGSGSKMKLVVNMIMGTMLNSFTEGMELCDKAGLPQDTLLEVLNLGAMANPMFQLKGKNIMAGKYDAHFPLKHAQKDMKLALALADQLGCSLPTTTTSNEQYESMLEASGDEDFCAVMKSNKTK